MIKKLVYILHFIKKAKLSFAYKYQNGGNSKDRFEFK